jgi:hypothetical protein
MPKYMKKTLVSLGLVLGFSYVLAHAKPRMKAHTIMDDIRFGIAAGITSSAFNYYPPSREWYIDDTEHGKFIKAQVIGGTRWGFHVSAWGAYQLSKYLDIALTMGYVTKGIRPKRYMDDILHYEKALDFNYLQTNVQLNIFPGKDRQFFFTAGGYVGYLLTAKKQTQYYMNNQKQGAPKTMNFREDTSTKDKLNNIDIGFVLGIGYEWKMGLIWDVNLSVGLREIVKGVEKMKYNHASQVNLGYNFAKLLK